MGSWWYVRMPMSWYRVFTWWYYVEVVGTLGLAAVVPFVDAAIQLRRASVWRLVAVYAGVDILLLVLLFEPGDVGALPNTVRSMLLVGGAVATMIAACVQLTSLRRQIFADLDSTQVLGVARAYSRNRAGFDRITADRSDIDCALLLVGLERSADDSEAKARCRDALFRLLEKALTSSGIYWSSCLHEEAEDRVIVIVPRLFPKTRLIDPFLGHLSAGVRHHNRYVSADITIRVRMAIHAGDIQLVDGVLAGHLEATLTSLLEAQPLRLALTAAPDTATVAVIISDNFHKEVIRPGHRGIDPESYTPVPVRVRDTVVRAWLHIPRHVHFSL
jgi:hypothetical protein